MDLSSARPASIAFAIESRRRHDEARRTELLATTNRTDIAAGERHRDLDLGRIATDASALFAHDVDQPGDLLFAPTGEEAVAVTRGALGGELGVAADDDRNATRLHRLRVGCDRSPLEELALEAFGIAAPERSNRGDRLARARGARLERHAERVEFLLQPTHADAEDGAAFREHVERSELLRYVGRVALREDHHAGGESDLARDRGDVREGQERIRDRQDVASRHLSALVVGVLTDVADRDEHVLDGP